MGMQKAVIRQFRFLRVITYFFKRQCNCDTDGLRLERENPAPQPVLKTPDQCLSFMWEPNKYRLTQLNPWNIVLIYLVLGFLWILFSDRLLEQLIDDPATLTQFQTYKGWFYVLVTSLLLLLLLMRYSARITHMRSDFLDRLDLYRSLLEQGNQVVLQVDDSQDFSYSNAAVKDILGYDEDEFRCMGDYESIVHQDDRDRFKDIRTVCDAGIRNNEPVKQQVRLRHKNGAWRWYQMILTDKRGFEHIDSRLLLIRDIHEETSMYERLRESQIRFEHLFQEAPVGYHSFGGDFTIIDINKSELNLLGCSREAVVGKKTWADLIVPDDLPTFEQHKKDLLEKGYVENLQYTIVREDGTRRSVILNARAFFDDQDRLLYTLGNVVDMTEQIRAQEEIRELNISLEKKVIERTRDLEMANRELESFAYSVSHDLRAPLRGIDGFSQALADKYAEKLDQRGLQYLDRVCKASQRMGMLIDDLLSLSRITRSELEYEQVDLGAVSREILETLKDREPDRQVDFDVSGDLVVTGDARLLRILMQNLLDNAWKYTSTRDRARIVVDSAEIDGRKTMFVRDNGVGFNMKYHDKLFVPFQRLHSQDDFPGTGIGLATVQRIIGRHGGTIRADSKENEGSVFYLFLPDKSV